MLTVMEASSFTPSVYSVHALTLLAEVNIECHAHLFALHLHNQCNKPVEVVYFIGCIQ